MSDAIRLILMKILIVILTTAIPAALSAQETTTAAETAGEPATAGETVEEQSTATDTAGAEARTASQATQEQTRHEVRSRFATLLRQHPSEAGSILALDPAMLLNEAFLARYPELGQFVAEHPEVRANPHFYLQDFRHFDEGRDGAVEQIVHSLTIVATFFLIALALAWLVRTIIEQKRWNRLSRTQSEVHNKILDRFGTSTELLEYIRTPAGTKFLESAPIPLHTERSPQNPPLTRVLWSVQIGVVVAAAGLGMLLVSGRFDEESAQGLFAMGAIALSVGIGFIGSAAVSLLLSRRLGLWPAESSEDAGLTGSIRSDA